MNVADGLFLLSSQCSFAAFDAAGEIGHSGVWEWKAGVPISGMCHLVGAQTDAGKKAQGY